MTENTSYGIFLCLDKEMFESLHKIDEKERKNVDIAVKYEGKVRNFSLYEFVVLLGFGSDSQLPNPKNVADTTYCTCENTSMSRMLSGKCVVCGKPQRC